ncbi:DNA polymerase III subunit epsilon [Slackia faecicanis]|uniref:DNA polymerase III subunit epsilon n=2 Tax=Slackia faecicanis TaxID=255723 RepID=A0A3N0ADS6_9ACTN|nr:DNA polymerase III subunit epsilon [Slackia faecicanis]
MSVYDFVSQGTPEDIVRRYARLKEVAERSDFGELDRNVVVLDTETTGFSQNHDELTQIAAARLERGEITDWFVTFVNPGKPIPDDVARLTDIHDEDVADAPSPEEARALLAEFVGDATVVAHNAAFDKGFTTKSPAGYPLMENLWVDSLDLARIALPRLSSHRLIDLVKAFDAPLSTHRADADVEALCAVYRILLAAIAEMPLDLVEYIAGLAPVEEWPTGAVFSCMASSMAAVEEAARGTDIVAKRYPMTVRGLRHARLAHLAQDEESAAIERYTGSIEFPDAREVEEAFSREGVVGGLYDEFEPRVEQSIMADSVLKAFSTGTNLVVEAGTGVGKSMAYLLPSALTALRSHAAVGVATKTNALLDQIVYKELPLLRAALGKRGLGTLDYVALKGFSHYPCLRLVDRLVHDGARSVTVMGKQVSQAPSIAALLSFIEQTEYDDMDALKLDFKALPRYAFTTSSRDCLRRKCPYYGTQCFVHGVRKKAEHAHIVVTNHSLFFCDLAADRGLLPEIRFWVVDEAHGAEAEARRALAVKLDASEMVRLANRLASEDAKRNPFVRLERRAPLDSGKQPEASTLFFGLTEKARARGKEFSEAALEYARHMKDLVACDTNKGNRSYETIDLWINDAVRSDERFAALRGFAKTFREQAERLIAAGNELIAFLEGVDGVADCQRDIATTVIDAKEMLQSCELIMEAADPRFVYSAKLSRKPERVAEELQAQVVDVGQMLGETLYEQTQSVVYASATVTIGEDFKSFMTAMGLNEGEPSRADTCLLGSSYDFDANMQVLVVNDIPEPNQPGYLEALQALLAKLHVAQQGSMLTLFTNRREMEACFEAVDPLMKEEGLRLVCQKWGVSTKGLRDDFLKDEHLSLFALKSFWEGFDAPGATLKGVVIPKLPFAKPTDPLSCERALRDSAAWSHYTLPQAVIEIKQAAGRLIRTSTDTGVLVLADRRLLTKGYGKTFLRSLPSKNVKACSAAEAVEIVRRASAGRDL